MNLQAVRLVNDGAGIIRRTLPSPHTPHHRAGYCPCVRLPTKLSFKAEDVLGAFILKACSTWLVPTGHANHAVERLLNQLIIPRTLFVVSGALFWG